MKQASFYGGKISKSKFGTRSILTINYLDRNKIYT